jgi:hypothetical protein
VDTLQPHNIVISHSAALPYSDASPPRSTHIPLEFNEIAIATLYGRVRSNRGEKWIKYILAMVVFDLTRYSKVCKKIPNVLILFLIYSISRFWMAGSGLGRSLSLIDVAELHGVTDRGSSLQPPTTASSSLQDVREGSGTLRRFETCTSTQFSTLRVTSQSGSACMEEGLALLGDGSSIVEQPEHEDHSVDNSILDYESDGSDPGSHTSHAAHKPPLSTAMETDVERAAAVPQEFDAMYHQCKSARLACKTDTFVSLSQEKLVREGCYCSVTTVWFVRRSL